MQDIEKYTPKYYFMVTLRGEYFWGGKGNCQGGERKNKNLNL